MILGVGDPVPGVGDSLLVHMADCGEENFVNVGCGALPPRQHVKPLGVQVGEQGRGPAATVKSDQHSSVVTDHRSKRGHQCLQLGDEGGAGLGHDHEQRVPVACRHPGFLGGRDRHLQPRRMQPADFRPALVSTSMSVNVNDPEQSGVRVVGGGEPFES